MEISWMSYDERSCLPGMESIIKVINPPINQVLVSLLNIKKFEQTTAVISINRNKNFNLFLLR